jgi:hypothetical protein
MGPPIKSGDDDASRAMTTFGRIRIEAALTADMPHLAVTMHVEPENNAILSRARPRIIIPVA